MSKNQVKPKVYFFMQATTNSYLDLTLRENYSSQKINKTIDLSFLSVLQRIETLALFSILNFLSSSGSLLCIPKKASISSLNNQSRIPSAFFTNYIAVRLSANLKKLSNSEKPFSCLNLDKWRASSLTNTIIARIRIINAWKSKDPNLNLQNLGIETLPECLSSSLFPCLRNLNVSCNKLSNLERIEKLTLLDKLDITSNPIDELEICEFLETRNIECISDFKSTHQLSSVNGAFIFTRRDRLNLLNLGLVEWMKSSSGNVTEASRRILDCCKINGATLDLSCLELDILPNCLSSKYLPNLRELNLSGNNLSNLDGLEKCSGLSKLNVSDNKLVNMNGVAPLLMNHLKDFTFYRNPITTDSLKAYRVFKSIQSKLVKLPKYNSLHSIDISPLIAKAPNSIYTWLTEITQTNEWQSIYSRQDIALTVLRFLRYALENPSYQSKFLQEIEVPLADFDNNIFVMLESMQPSAELFFHGSKSQKLEKVLKNAWETRRERLDLTSFHCDVIPDELLPYLKGVRNLTFKAGTLSNLEWLKACPELISLTITNNKIKSTKGLRHCPKIETLILEGNQISDLTDLSLLQNLQYLNLSSNQIENFEEIKKCRELRIVKINGNLSQSREGIENLPSLIFLSTESNQDIVETSLEEAILY